MKRGAFVIKTYYLFQKTINIYTMKMASRIKKVRELTGKRQSEVAALLHVTQQAYCGLEQTADNAKLATLRKFCTAMQIDLAYLVTDEIPITDETLKKYGRKNFAEIIAGCEELRKQMEESGDSKMNNQNSTN